MALYEIEKNSSGVPTGNYKHVAGGTLYADSPIGTILAYGGTSAPSGWMICDGTSLLRASYPELFAVIGTAFGSADSTHFNIPDMRESVLVGSGTSDRSGITAHDSYTVGQFKDDQIQNFSLRTAEYGGSTSWVDGFGVRGNGSDVQFRQLYSDGQTYLSDDARVGTTTHGKQLGVNYIIKAKMVALPADLASGVEEYIDENAKSPISSSNKLVTESDLNQTVAVTLNIGYGIVVKKSGHTVFVSWALNGDVASNTLSAGNNTIATGLPKPIAVQVGGGATSAVCLDGAGANGQMNPTVGIRVSRNGELLAYNGSGSAITSVNVGAYLVYYTDD